MKNINKIILIVGVVIIMLIPIVVEVISKNTISVVTMDNFDEFVSGTDDYNFALLYVGENDNEEKKAIKEIVDKYDDNSAKIGVDTAFMDVTKLSNSDKKKLFNTSTVKKAYIFAVNGEVVKTEVADLSKDMINTYVKEFTSSGVDDSILSYKEFKNASEYKKLVNDKKKVTMAVFGRSSCYWCNMFKPVFNTVAGEYNVDIYYINKDGFEKEKYDEFVNLDLVIPASCNDGEEKKLSEGFGTPLTLFTKGGKVVDCISGYLNKKALVTKLKTVGIIKE